MVNVAWMYTCTHVNYFYCASSILFRRLISYLCECDKFVDCCVDKCGSVVYHFPMPLELVEISLTLRASFIDTFAVSSHPDTNMAAQNCWPGRPSAYRPTDVVAQCHFLQAMNTNYLYLNAGTLP